jgi:hypothetical protein
MIAAALIAASLAGVVGLVKAPPRPNAQEWWATVALAPVLLLFTLAVLGAL